MTVVSRREEIKYENHIDIVSICLNVRVTSANGQCVDVCVCSSLLYVYSQQCLSDLTGIINVMAAV